jgi:hypothetical protein
MERYLINLLNFKVTKTTLPKGLQLNKKNFAYGFVVAAPNLIEATDTLNKIEEKWRAWVNDYNSWVGMPEPAKSKFVRKQA